MDKFGLCEWCRKHMGVLVDRYGEWSCAKCDVDRGPRFKNGSYLWEDQDKEYRCLDKPLA